MTISSTSITTAYYLNRGVVYLEIKSICIDYGHTLTGSDTGAEGNGLREQDLTRELGVVVTSKLRRLGLFVTETCVDSCISLNDSLNRRIEIINNSMCGLSVSIHFNSGGGTGSEIFTYNGVETVCCSSILANLEEIGLFNRGIKDGSRLALVRRPVCKAILIEVGFIDNSSDMQIYRANINNIANAIVDGITGQLFVMTASTSDNKVYSGSGWIENSTGWWYRLDNGDYYKDSWQEIDGKWYSFDNQGYARRGSWLQDNGYWYYLKNDCTMCRNEWQWIDGDCYYFGDKGGMYANCETPDGYRVGESGAWTM